MLEVRKLKKKVSGQMKMSEKEYIIELGFIPDHFTVKRLEGIEDRISDLKNSLLDSEEQYEKHWSYIMNSEEKVLFLKGFGPLSNKEVIHNAAEHYQRKILSIIDRINCLERDKEDILINCYKENRLKTT
jgi:hypothetical protein